MQDTENVKVMHSPLECAGKKTTSVKEILKFVPKSYDRWLEPFAGSCVVGFSECHENAIFSDIIPYGMQFFKLFKEKKILISEIVEKTFMYAEIFANDPKEYPKLRNEFAENKDPLVFFILSFFCHHGLMEFTKTLLPTSGLGRIPKRKLRSLRTCLEELQNVIMPNWEFRTANYHVLLHQAKKDDFCYIDPPFTTSRLRGTWNIYRQQELLKECLNLPCPHLLTLWNTRGTQHNPEIALWKDCGYTVSVIHVRCTKGKKGTDAILYKDGENQPNKKRYRIPDVLSTQNNHAGHRIIN